jgi:hypothetical protein
MAKTVRSDIVESFRELTAYTLSLATLSKDIKKDDRLAVIIFYASVEALLNFLIKKMCKHGSAIVKNMCFMNKVRILDEIGVIDDKLFKNLTLLKKLRDNAAHIPAEKLEWKGKFDFHKESDYYKNTVKKFGEPQSLTDYLYFFWNIFTHHAWDVNATKKFKEIVSAHKKLGKKNK